jgi:DNA-binding NarL/FixJ family response regulator
MFALRPMTATGLSGSPAPSSRTCACSDASSQARGFASSAPRAAVVVLAQEPSPDDLLDCVRAGAVGYAPAALDAAGLRRILRAVASDEAVVPRSMLRDLLLELQGGGSPGAGLTQREAQVLAMLRRGHTTATIAARLDIVPVTVRRHIAQVVNKLGVENRSALVGPAPLHHNGVDNGDADHARSRASVEPRG